MSKDKKIETLPDAAAVTKHVEIILDQVKHLRNAVDHTIERAKSGKGNSFFLQQS